MPDPFVNPEVEQAGQFELSAQFKDAPAPRNDNDITYPSSEKMGIQGKADFRGELDAPKFDKAFNALRNFTLDSTEREWTDDGDPDYGKKKTLTLEDGTSMVVINEGHNNVSIRVDKGGAFYFSKEKQGGTLEIAGYDKGPGFDLQKSLSKAEQFIGTVLNKIPSAK